MFAYLNTNKRSLLVSGDTGPAEVVRAHPGTYDVILVDGGFLGAAPDRVVADLRAASPASVVVTVTPFGIGGPYADYRGYDITASAAGGISYGVGERDRPPLPLPYGQSDKQAGLCAASAALMGVLDRRRRTVGQHVDVSVQEVMAALHCGYFLPRYIFSGGVVGLRHGRAGGAQPYPHTVLPCKDGLVTLVAPKIDQWIRFLGLMGSPAWANEPRYRNRRAMQWEYKAEVDALVMPWFADKTKAELLDLFLRHRIPFAPIMDGQDLADSDHLRVRGALGEQELSGGGAFLAPTSPFRFSRSTSRSGRAPRLGEHGRAATADVAVGAAPTGRRCPPGRAAGRHAGARSRHRLGRRHRRPDPRRLRGRRHQGRVVVAHGRQPHGQADRGRRHRGRRRRLAAGSAARLPRARPQQAQRRPQPARRGGHGAAARPGRRVGRADPQLHAAGVPVPRSRRRPPPRGQRAARRRGSVGRRRRRTAVGLHRLRQHGGLAGRPRAGDRLRGRGAGRLGRGHLHRRDQRDDDRLRRSRRPDRAGRLGYRAGDRRLAVGGVDDGRAGADHRALDDRSRPPLRGLPAPPAVPARQLPDPARPRRRDPDRRLDQRRRGHRRRMAEPARRPRVARDAGGGRRRMDARRPARPAVRHRRVAGRLDRHRRRRHRAAPPPGGRCRRVPGGEHRGRLRRRAARPPGNVHQRGAPAGRRRADAGPAVELLRQPVRGAAARAAARRAQPRGAGRGARCRRRAVRGAGRVRRRRDPARRIGSGWAGREPRDHAGDGARRGARPAGDRPESRRHHRRPARRARGQRGRRDREVRRAPRRLPRGQRDGLAGGAVRRGRRRRSGGPVELPPGRGPDRRARRPRPGRLRRRGRALPRRPRPARGAGVRLVAGPAGPR